MGLNTFLRVRPHKLGRGADGGGREKVTAASSLEDGPEGGEGKGEEVSDIWGRDAFGQRFNKKNFSLEITKNNSSHIRGEGGRSRNSCVRVCYFS